MTQDKILIARRVHRLEREIMAMVCYCGESAFGSAEGGLSINAVLILNPRLFWAPLTRNYLALTV